MGTSATRPSVQNAIALIISSAGSSTIGILFWAFAAHLATKAAVGRTTAEIAAMILLTNLPNSASVRSLNDSFRLQVISRADSCAAPTRLA